MLATLSPTAFTMVAGGSTSIPIVEMIAKASRPGMRVHGHDQQLAREAAAGNAAHHRAAEYGDPDGRRERPGAREVLAEEPVQEGDLERWPTGTSRPCGSSPRWG